MKILAIAAAAALFIILFVQAAPSDAGGVTFYDRNSTPIPQGRYDRIVADWYDCLDQTQDHQAFKECMEEKGAGPRYGEPLVSDVPGLAADPSEEGEVIWLVPPVEDQGAAPAAGTQPAPSADTPPPRAGSAASPSVIERDIQVPGGGKLKVKEYKYQ